MTAKMAGTDGVMTVVGLDVGGFVTRKVECNTYGDSFFQIKGLGVGKQLFKIDVVERNLEAGKSYKIDGLNQSSATYMNVDGDYLRELWGQIKFVILDFENEKVDVEFTFKDKNNGGEQKEISGKGDFKGITPKQS
jgi:hypothetical protein